jgi:hypothetical protein
MTLLIIIHLLGGLISESPMLSMEKCEQLVARIPRSKTEFLYCISVGAGYTPLVDFKPIPEELAPAQFYRRKNHPRICRFRDDCLYP